MTALDDTANYIHTLKKIGQKLEIKLLVSNTVYPFVMDKTVMGEEINLPLDDSGSKYDEIRAMMGKRPQLAKADPPTTQQKIFSFVQKFVSLWKHSDQ